MIAHRVPKNPEKNCPDGELPAQLKAIINYKKELKANYRAERRRLAGRVAKHRNRLKDKYRQAGIRAAENDSKEKFEKMRKDIEELCTGLKLDAVSFSFHLASIVIENELSYDSSIIARKLRRLAKAKVIDLEDNILFTRIHKDKRNYGNLTFESTEIEIGNGFGTVRYGFCRELEELIKEALVKPVPRQPDIPVQD